MRELELPHDPPVWPTRSLYLKLLCPSVACRYYGLRRSDDDAGCGSKLFLLTDDVWVSSRVFVAC